MDKLLVICGPTAAGKTSLALSIAGKFNAEIISADSRQVYRGMDIGTGKDIPANARRRNSTVGTNNRKIPYYLINGIKIWGYDLVNPGDNFSVSQYIEIAEKIICDVHNRNKLPIVAGGTGLYVKGLVDGVETSDVPPNLSLRKSLEGKSVQELFRILTDTDSNKSVAMNSSDSNNPRRLIRAIEIAGFTKPIKRAINRFADNLNVLFIGLKISKPELDLRIRKRVSERIENGQLSEITKLLRNGTTWNSQSMQALGYKQWKDYFELLKSKTEAKEFKDGLSDSALAKEKQNAMEKWINAEIKYSKRQMTWFKKDKRINWFDISKMGWRNDLEKLVKKWQNK